MEIYRESQKIYMTQSLSLQKYRMDKSDVCVKGDAGFRKNEEEMKSLRNLL